MSKERPSVRLFVEQDLEPEAEIAVDAAQAHYLTRVMRLKSGDRVRLFNGRHGEWLAGITSVGRSRCELLVSSMLRAQRAERGPVLAFAPIKKEPMHTLVAKATELGAERLLLVITRHTVLEQVNLERMRAHVVEASEQCGRLTIPDLDPPEPLDSFLAAWPVARPLLFMDERASGRPIDEAIAACATLLPGPPPPGILVGPEGGFAKEEAERLRALGFVLPVSLGPRILRAETAALAALACWQAFAGDWRPNRSG